MDRHVLRYIKLQPLDVLEQRNSVRADIRRRRRALRRWRVEVGVEVPGVPGVRWGQRPAKSRHRMSVEHVDVCPAEQAFVHRKLPSK